MTGPQPGQGAQQAARQGPAAQPGPSASTAAQPATQPATSAASTGQDPATTGTSTSGQPAGASGQSAGARRRSTPSLLRLARGLATAAALLTGVAATGTFDTSGVNSTPNVIAAHWEASERAGTQVAAARLAVAQGAAESAASVPEADRLFDPAVFPERLGEAADWLARSGADSAGGLTDVALAGQAALGATDQESAASAYQEVADLTDSTLRTTQALSGDHAQDLRTGSRSGLTAVVGGLATLLLGGLLVWLALLTRRIVNVPLLIATAITAGLTYVSLNPSALPLDIDQRVDAAGHASHALQDVRLARAAQYGQVLGLGDGQEAVEQATGSLTVLGDRGVSDDWRAVHDGQDELDAAASASAGLSALTATQEDFAQAETRLTALVDDRLGGSVGDVGRPALITSGLALVLGVVAAGLAWTGLTQRLRDYR